MGKVCFKKWGDKDVVIKNSIALEWMEFGGG